MSIIRTARLFFLDPSIYADRGMNGTGVEGTDSTAALQRWGVAAALGGGIVNAVGYTVQRRVLVRTPRAYLRRPWWWMGFALLLAAETLGGVALALVPASVVVALGSVSVVASAMLAALNGEPLNVDTPAATMCIVVGRVLGGLVTPAVDDLSTSDELAARLESLPSIVYHALAACAIVVLHLRTYRRPRVPLVVVGLYAGLVSSITALWFRPIVTIVLNREWSSFGTSYLPYVSIAVVALTGTWAAAFLEPKGLGTFLQSEWIPVHFVSCLVFFGVSGEVVYRDFGRVNVSTIVTLLVALVNVSWGIAVLHHPR